jgi:hypothetical protein
MLALREMTRRSVAALRGAAHAPLYRCLQTSTTNLRVLRPVLPAMFRHPADGNLSSNG